MSDGIAAASLSAEEVMASAQHLVVGSDASGRIDVELLVHFSLTFAVQPGQDEVKLATELEAACQAADPDCILVTNDAGATRQRRRGLLQVPSCTACTDESSPFLASCDGLDKLPDTCNVNKYWAAGRYCQQSCYSAGLAYEGDFCCPQSGSGIGIVVLARPVTSGVLSEALPSLKVSDVTVTGTALRGAIVRLEVTRLGGVDEVTALLNGSFTEDQMTSIAADLSLNKNALSGRFAASDAV